MNRDHEQVDPPPDVTELMDVCRPGSEDLRLPEMQALSTALESDSNLQRRWQKSQQLDAALGQAIREVPVPAALAARLRAALEIAGSSSANSDGTLSDGTLSDAAISSDAAVRFDVGTSDGRSPRSETRSWWTRRRVSALSAAALVVAIVIGVVAIRRPDPNFSSQLDVAVQVDHWLGSLRVQAWRKSELPTVDFPLPHFPGLRSPYRWQSISPAGSTIAVICYEVSPSTHLFACRGADASSLTERPPSAPTKLASGWLVGGWRSEELVYVLAVRGSPAEYLRRVQSQQTIAGVLGNGIQFQSGAPRYRPAATGLISRPLGLAFPA